MILMLVPVLFLSFFVYYVLTKDFDYWEKRNVRGPQPQLFFGNIKESVLRRKPLYMVTKEIYNAYPEEKVVGLFRMKTPYLLLRDPELIKHVLIKDFDNFVDRGMEFGKKGLGANLFHTDGDTWRVLRHHFTPMFTSGKLKNMLHLMVHRGDLLMNYIEELINVNPEQDVKDIAQKYTMTTISATAFGLDIDYSDRKIFEQVEEIDKKIFNKNYAGELDMMFPGILKKLGSTLFPRSLDMFFSKMIKNAITKRDGKPSSRNDFVDLMLDMQQSGTVTKKAGDGELSLEVTDAVMAAQAFVFYAAGYETSASTMSFMLYQLALNPGVQEKMLAHVDEVLARHGGRTSYECLADLTYMKCVFDETLRMHPVVEFVQRRALKDYRLPGTDIVVAEGQTVLTSQHGMHYDEKYYPNPQKFDPERFAAKNSKTNNPLAFLPFGLGPRNCIGSRFALVQSKVFLAKFLSKYRVELTPNTRVPLKFDPSKIQVSSCGGIPLRIVPREK